MENAPLPRPAFVYILRCADETLYTGWTYDVKKRLATHNAGRGAKYTRARLPAALVYCVGLPDKSAALRREFTIKRMSRPEKIALAESCTLPKELL